MSREVYGKNGDKVVVLDARDLHNGEYTVEVLVRDGGYITVFSDANLDKCLKKVKELERGAVWSAYGTPIPNDCGGLLKISK